MRDFEPRSTNVVLIEQNLKPATDYLPGLSGLWQSQAEAHSAAVRLHILRRAYNRGEKVSSTPVVAELRTLSGTQDQERSCNSLFDTRLHQQLLHLSRASLLSLLSVLRQRQLAELFLQQLGNISPPS